MTNIHIYYSDIRNESRILKETKSLLSNNICSKITIIGFWTPGLPEYENIDYNLSVQRIKLCNNILFNKIKIPGIKFISFYLRSIKLIKNLNPNMINIHMLLLLPLGLFIKKRNKCFFVYDAHELETETRRLKGLEKSLCKIIERRIINSIDLIIVVSESIAEWYVNEYNISRPVVVLNAPNKRNINKTNLLRDKLGIRGDQIILLYQGALFSGRGIDLILDAFKIRTDDKVVVVFMGYGELDKSIIDCSKNYKNIFFLPAVSPDIVLEYTSSADVGISLIENICLSYFYCMPNKLFEYAMVKLPILVSNMKEMTRIVTENNMGIAIEDYSPEGINIAINKFLSKDLNLMKENAYRVACENSWEIQEKKLIESYNQLINRKENV